MESHEPDLRAEVHDDEQVRRIHDDHRTAALDQATMKLLDFATKLSLNPKEMSRDDIEGLRHIGFADETILDAVQTIGYFNYANRVMDALGIEPEPDMRHGGR
jgi:uncharacterized peroxidase-related enzyme